jgi:hypothetical protein
MTFWRTSGDPRTTCASRLQQSGWHSSAALAIPGNIMPCRYRLTPLSSIPRKGWNRIVAEVGRIMSLCSSP